MASIFGQPYGDFTEPPALGTFEPRQLRRQPWENSSFTGTQLGQGRQDFVPPPRPFASPAPESFVSPDREPPSFRQTGPKALGSILGTEASGSEGAASGMTLLDILFGGASESIPAQRNLITSEPGMFGLSEDRLDDFLMGVSRKDPATFIQELLRRMKLRPSSLLGGL